MTTKTLRHELEETIKDDGMPAVIKPFIVLQLEVSDAVLTERQRQNNLYGFQRHDYGKWLSIIGEEFGESCQALGPLVGLHTGKDTDASDPYTELIQLAATAQAAAEQILEERRKGRL